MRSVPIVIDKTIRHLRFTFSAVEDLDQLVPGGFLSVFNREADASIAHLLLWAGLQHEQVEYEDIGLFLAVCPDITHIWKTITYSLINDEWISVDRENTKSEESKTLPEIIMAIESQALEYGLLPSELYSLTPREFNLVQRKYQLKDNVRTGLICATLANIHTRKKNGSPFEPKDFIRTGEEERRQSVNEQAEIIAGMFGG